MTTHRESYNYLKPSSEREERGCEALSPSDIENHDFQEILKINMDHLYALKIIPVYP